MGYVCPKNTFLRVKPYIQRIYLTLLSTTVKIHRNYKSFFTTQLVCIFLAQTLHTFDKNILSKCKVLDFQMLGLKFTKFFMSFFKQNVSFSSKFGLLFSVIRDNFFALFQLKIYILLTKVVHQSANFQTCHCSR